jgi:hypothetical protein
MGRRGLHNYHLGAIRKMEESARHLSTAMNKEAWLPRSLTLASIRLS